MNKPEQPAPLSPQGIIELKRQLADDPPKAALACSRLAIDAVETLHGLDLKKSFSYGLVIEVGTTAIRYSNDVQSALSMGVDGAWPEDAKVNPEQLREAVDSIVAGEQHG